MKAIIRSSAGPLAFLGMSALANSASADASVVGLRPYLDVSFENKDKELELGPELSARDDTHRVQLLARVPFETDSKPSTVQITKETGKWRVVGSYKFDLDTTGEDGAASYLRLGGRVEWGVERFSYTPLGEAKQKDLEHSFAAEVGGLYFSATRSKASIQLAPQLLVRYDRAYKAADKVGIVSLSGEDPAIVKQVTLGAPTVKSPLTFRLAMPVYFGALGQPFAFGPAAYCTLSGSGDDALETDLIRLRWEGWVYYFPVAAGVTNLRMGAAIFGTHRVNGKDDLDRNVIGAMLQLRLATTLLDY